MRTQLFKKSFIAGVSSLALLSSLAMPASGLTVRDDVGVAQSELNADDVRFDGAIQLYLLQPNGAINFNCSGSLINARTIITAAHCYNGLPSTAYGLGAGQIAPIIAYGPNTFDALFNFLGGGGRVIDDRNGLTFGSSVILHPDADLANGPNALPFPGADVALVSLQDPLTSIPSYSLLFSPVPVGTRVTQVAYGTEGTGLTGATGGIDGRRQVGENIIGLIGSQNDFVRGVFGTPGISVFGNQGGDQLLYFIDFDQPDRTGDECVRDDFGDIVCDGAQFVVTLGGQFLLPGPAIDYFPGDALPQEAGTAPGDSGSAIFVDGNDGDLLIAGVLSGGFTFTTPIPSGFGDISYYQPLFNFFDFIAEFNPYKYVSANAGDGNWSDASHWVQDLDPGYIIIDGNGNLVNGLPTGPEVGAGPGGAREGIIFDNDVNDFLATPAAASAGQTGTDVQLVSTNFRAEGEVGLASASASGESVANTASVISATLTTINFRADGEVDLAAGLTTGDSATASTSIVSSSRVGDGARTGDLPVVEIEATPELDTFLFGDFDAPSLANGPGATGFIPTNSQIFLADGSINPNFVAEYFDVTLRNVGTTFADIDVEVDKLTLDNVGARLVINENTNFTSIIDTQIATGTLDVVGNFTSRDILNGGLITGTGSIFTEALFNLGTINAGAGLNVTGDVVFTSVGVLAFGGEALNVDGNISLDGGLVLGFSGTPTFGQSGTLLNFTGTRIGEFSSVSDLPGVLFADVDYSQDGRVTFDVQAGSYTTFIGGDASDNQRSIAGLLDDSRGSFGALSAVFSNTDLLEGDPLNIALDTLAPNNALGGAAADLARSEALGSQLGRRLGSIGNGGTRGVAQFSSNGRASGDTRILVAANGLSAFEASAANRAGTIQLKEGWGLFGDITYYTGDAATTLAGARSDIDGFSFTGGVDYQFSRGLTLGAYVNYGTGDVELNGILSDGEFTGVAGGLYAHQKFGDRMSLSGYFGYGTRDADLQRTVILGAQTQAISGDTDTTEFVGGAEVAFHIPVHSGKVNITPSVRFDYANFNIDGYSETGGTAALTIGDQENSTAQLSAGAMIEINNGVAPKNVRPVFGGRYVRDLNASEARIVTSFVNAPGNTAIVLGPQRDQDWFEVEAGIDFDFSENVTGELHVTQTIERSDLDYTSISAKVRVKF